MVVGGTSAINAAAALWGSPEDFAEWAALGNPQWAWDKVVPYFARIEDDPDGQGALHGRGGPISIQRYARHEWTAFQDAFFEATLAAGCTAVADHNAAATNGVGPWPMNRRGPMRVSTALAYLGPARQRSNLTILPRTLVSRIAFDGRRATGVELLTDGVAACIKTGHVVLSAGAIGSPAILLRSGIGPAAALQRLGIATLVDQVGVGARLWDHPSITLRLLPRPEQFDAARDPRFQVVARYTCTGSADVNDMLLVPLGRVDLSGLPALRREAEQSVVVGIAAAVMQPHAAGYLELTSADPWVPPRIALDAGEHPDDWSRLQEGVRRAWQISRSPELMSVTVRVLGLDEHTVESDAKLSTYIRANMGTFCHAAGTARMGPDGDAGAVVDQYGRVRGVDNVWVADASIMPAVLRAVPNLTTIMLGERIAEWLRA